MAIAAEVIVAARHLAKIAAMVMIQQGLVGVAQLVRASDCGSESRGFESRHPPSPQLPSSHRNHSQTPGNPGIFSYLPPSLLSYRLHQRLATARNENQSVVQLVSNWHPRALMRYPCRSLSRRRLLSPARPWAESWATS